MKNTLTNIITVALLTVALGVTACKKKNPPEETTPPTPTESTSLPADFTIQNL